MITMLFPGVAEYDDVINVRLRELTQSIQQSINHPLKGCWSSLKTKWHSSELIESKWSHKCCLWDGNSYKQIWILPNPLSQVKESNSRYNPMEPLPPDLWFLNQSPIRKKERKRRHSITPWSSNLFDAREGGRDVRGHLYYSGTFRCHIRTFYWLFWNLHVSR